MREGWREEGRLGERKGREDRENQGDRKSQSLIFISRTTVPEV